MKAIGKYQVIDEIGAGAAGTTYRVRDTAGERELALKILYSSPAASPETKDQFCRTLAKYTDLRHPNIAKVLDLGEADGALYVATEFLNGIDLRRHFDERRVLPLEDKLEFIASVLDALTVPHSKAVAHGDLKPTNIFIVAGKYARLLDFGSGKWLETIMAAGVKPTAILPNYLAPEQIMGEPFDPRSDIFSVAMILYELLTGKYPFQVDANLIPREIMHSEPAPLRKLDSQIPEELEFLLTRALNKNREQRLQSAAEFSVALNKIAQQLRDSRIAPEPVIAGSMGAAPPAPSVVEKPAPTTPVMVIPKAPAVTPSLPAPTQPPQTITVVAAPASTVAAPPPFASAPVASAPVTSAPVVAPPPATGQPALAAIKSAAQGAPKKPIPGAKMGPWRRRVIPIAIAGLLAVGLFGTLLSRQSSQASPQKSEAPATQPNIATPSAPAAVTAPAETVSVPIQAVDAAPAQPVLAPPAAPRVVEVKPAPEVILRGQVRSLWEAGKYSQALALVDAILTENPTLPEARAWKKKIRAAQDAEAAIK